MRSRHEAGENTRRTEIVEISPPLVEFRSHSERLTVSGVGSVVVLAVENSASLRSSSSEKALSASQNIASNSPSRPASDSRSASSRMSLNCNAR